jgi:nitronate monooxygenase
VQQSKLQSIRTTLIYMFSRLAAEDGTGMIAAGFNYNPGSPHLQMLEKELAAARDLVDSEDAAGKPLPIGAGFITFHPSTAQFSTTVMPILQKHRPIAVWLFAPDEDLQDRLHPIIIQQLHDAGIKAIVQVGNIASARQAVQDGADVLVAQGMDAGGHMFAGAASIVTLVPEMRNMLSKEFPDRPVGLLAAGGISNGSGVAAALALGR